MTETALIELVEQHCHNTHIKYVGYANIGRDVLIWVLGKDSGAIMAKLLDEHNIKHTTPVMGPNGIEIYVAL